MPGSILGELILQPILELVVYFIGRVVVSVFTFGQIKCDRLLADTPRRKLRWCGAYHRRGRQIYLTPEMTQLVGLLFVAAVVGGYFLVRHHE